MRSESFLSLIVLLIFISALDPYLNGLRYVKYVLPVISILYWFNKSSVELYVTPSIRAFMVMSVWLTCFVWMGNSYGYADLIFILCSLSPFLVLRDVYFSINKALFLLVLTFLVVELPILLKGGFSYSIIESKSSLENHTFSFVFGLFSIYFLRTNNTKLFIFCLIFCFLSLKRISLIGIFLVLFLSFLPFRVERYITPIIMVLANLMYVLVAYFVTTDVFNELCVEYFNKSAGLITQGRNVLYDQLFFDMGGSYWSYLFGVGLGESYTVASSSLGLETKFNLHSDVLKIFYESGVFIFILFFWFLYNVRPELRYMPLYLNVVLLTDNVSTYVFVMFFYFLLMRSLESRVEAR